MRHDSKATGWTFDCPLHPGDMPPPGGIVLQNVRHDGHNFAKDIRVVALWIEIEHRDASGTPTITRKQIRILDASNFFTVSAVRTLEPKDITHTLPASPGGGGQTTRVFKFLKEVDTALYFDRYFGDGKGNYLAYGVAATYQARDLMVKLGFDNCDKAGLTVEQIFLFSRYSNSPRHEPSGGLSAARCHPFVHYAFVASDAFDAKRPHTRIKSIRFDYRLHLTIDRHHDVATNAKLTSLQNQAGLFADSDSFERTAHRGMWNVKTRVGISKGAFEAVEKPLLFEVWAFGLVKGFPRNLYAVPSPDDEPGMDLRCWDNVHWWGARGSAGLPSAPGAFHAAHIHWRWGSAASVVASGPPFEPDVWPAGLASKETGIIIRDFSPLVDPRIFIQTIRVAVVLNSPSLDPARQRLVDLSESTWKTLFHPGLRPAPFPLEKGRDIVLWYSTEVHREVTGYVFGKGDPSSVKPGARQVFRAMTDGTVFLHGIFFAHDAEPDPMWIANAALGSTREAYWPKSEVEISKSGAWFRPAE